MTRLRVGLAGAALAGLVGVGVVGLAACSPARREAASLAAAVERFHKAENTEKPAAADFLARVPCTDRDVCEAKQACVEASSATAKALRLMAEAQVGVADLKAKKMSPDDPAAQELPGKLSLATQLLADGHAAMPGCDALVLKLKAVHGI